MGKINDQTIKTPVGTDRLLGSDQDTTPTGGTANYTVDSVGTYLLGTRTSVPASATAAGVAGHYAVAAGFIYICVATNTWQRVATATWS
tara:strand:+ start:1834 stop:2100 length:267 start_codon:yes stop_codon:yes gene_type:complete